MVAGTSALAPTADQLAAAPAAWQAPFNLLPPYPEARRKPCSHCCGRRASPRPTSPHRDASLRHLTTSPRHTSPHLPHLTSPPHLTALYRHASPRLISPPDRHASPHLTSPPRLTSPHRLALRAAVGPVDARAATTACARCHRRPALRVRASSVADLPWGAQAAATLPEAKEAEAAAAEARADAAADGTAAGCGWSDAGSAPGAGAAEGEGGGGGGGKAGLQAGRA
eukprot:scaffold96417_cov66-Phaeocystis_antarctica.AAC.1